MSDLVPIGWFNVIVLCSKIRRCDDEVHVEVGVVVFLKLKWIQLETAQRRWVWKSTKHLIQSIRIYTTTSPSTN